MIYMQHNYGYNRIGLDSAITIYYTILSTYLERIG
jgi:hypothetical protein